MDWGTRFVHPVAYGKPMLNGKSDRLKGLAKQLVSSASAEFLLGRDTEAIELLRDVRAEARALQNEAPFLRILDLSMEIDGPGLNRALALANSLGSPSEPAAAAHLRAYLNDLLDESDFDSGRVCAMEGERMLSLDMLPRQAEVWLPGATGRMPRAIMWALQPMFARKFMRHTAYYTAYGRALNCPNVPACRAILLTVPMIDYDSQAPIEQAARLVYASGAVSFHPYADDGRFRYLADRRATAIVVALRLFALDHDGSLPDQLSELIPKYVTTLPADPMRADGRTFGYLPRAKPPILYSVGNDGKDDGGAFRSDTVGLHFTFRWYQRDAVYPLTTQPRTAPRTLPVAPPPP